ncbi:MAG: hypothetical protein PVI01_05370 [Gemmatimonadales bacterium]|jgi:hypothetical protein
MMDDRFDDVVRELAQDYNRPPETPRELMWARIRAVRQEREERRRQLRVLYSPWTRWGLGIAAALAIGIGIGRFALQPGPEVGPVAVTPGGGAPASLESPRRSQLAFRVMATQHFSRAETFLTSFRTGPQPEAGDAEFWRGAGELLSNTRLMLDSPVADDPVTKGLLEELELVLAQVVQLAYVQGRETEVELITQGIERKGLLPRLRTAIPAGTGAGMEGAL